MEIIWATTSGSVLTADEVGLCFWTTWNHIGRYFSIIRIEAPIHAAKRDQKLIVLYLTTRGGTWAETVSTKTVHYRGHRHLQVEDSPNSHWTISRAMNNTPNTTNRAITLLSE